MENGNQQQMYSEWEEYLNGFQSAIEKEKSINNNKSLIEDINVDNTRDTFIYGELDSNKLSNNSTRQNVRYMKRGGVSYYAINSNVQSNEYFNSQTGEDANENYDESSKKGGKKLLKGDSNSKNRLSEWYGVRNRRSKCWNSKNKLI